MSYFIFHLEIESMEHLYLECPYISSLWIAIRDIFGMRVSFNGNSLMFMFETNCYMACSSQIWPLWIMAIVSVFGQYGILETKFEGASLVGMSILTFAYALMRRNKISLNFVKKRHEQRKWDGRSILVYRPFYLIFTNNVP